MNQTFWGAILAAVFFIVLFMIVTIIEYKQHKASYEFRIKQSEQETERLRFLLELDKQEEINEDTNS